VLLVYVRRKKRTIDRFCINCRRCALFRVAGAGRGQAGERVTWIQGTGARNPQAAATRAHAGEEEATPTGAELRSGRGRRGAPSLPPRRQTCRPAGSSSVARHGPRGSGRGGREAGPGLEQEGRGGRLDLDWSRRAEVTPTRPRRGGSAAPHHQIPTLFCRH
jgi:hypothetical protein